MDKANDEQNKSAKKSREFKSITKPKNFNMIKEKSDVTNNGMTLLKEKETICNGFENGIFLLPNQSIVLPKPEKSSSSENSNNYLEYSSNEEKNIRKKTLKILTSKQMLQRLLIALAQVQTDNTSGN